MNTLSGLNGGLKLSVRNLLRQKTFGLVSVIGLALASAILVAAYVIEQYRYVNHYSAVDIHSCPGLRCFWRVWAFSDWRCMSRNSGGKRSVCGSCWGRRWPVLFGCLGVRIGY